MPNRWALLALLASATAPAKPPRLTVLISVDAMGSDVFLRARPRMKAGLAQLAAQGAFFPTVRYQFAEAVTAAGHATLSTGANPWRHGIVSNRVFSRASGKEEPILFDPSHPVLEAPLGSDDVSPVNLMAETLADRLRLSTHQKGKVVAISAKARSAITMGGRLGQAWWFNETVGKFVTGTYYAKEFPGWMKAFNDRKLPESYHGKEWSLLSPAKEYSGEDDRPFESDWYALGRAFPHPLSGGLPSPGPQSFAALASSPFMNDILVQLAKAALEGEQLGKDEVPDLLAVSFSATDRIYHLYGPYSWEMQDAMLRLDKAVGELLAAADKAAGGRANLMVAVSADHGGAAIPEEWLASGIEAARVHPADLQRGLDKELQPRFGADLVLGVEEVDVYLNGKALAERKLDGAAVRRAAAKWLQAQPGVALAAARDDLFACQTEPGLLEYLKVGFYPERSGDVLFMLKPFHVLTEEQTGTSHGTAYAYDSQVPFILAGKGVKPGVYRQQISAVDVAPTLAAALEIGLPAMAEGSIRAEALK
ncbi:MAG: alkaline phosphatase family protein [Myxococcales bacterium]|nr:alkaline phosphatase family protein [Myxococcales bacterium]